MHIKICHLTSAHPRTDSRIFSKMCASLSAHGFEVTLIVADNLGNATINQVNIVDVGRQGSGRVRRMTSVVSAVYSRAVVVDADVYHLHDPELIPIGVLLKLRGKKVIFDSHEDVAAQMLSKPYLNRWTSAIVAKLYRAFEVAACSRFDGIITATEKIQSRFNSINNNVAVIHNYPIIEEFHPPIIGDIKKQMICYAGGIYAERGIREVCHALESVQPNVTFALCGLCSEQEFLNSLERLPCWKQVKYLGNLDRIKVAQVYAQSIAGMVTFHPLPNHVESLPTKMFEYMCSGLPVIASNFPLWKEIVDDAQCGLCVDPMNPLSIASAIQYLLQHPIEAQQMGARGRNVVLEKYNWNNEESSLIAFYNRLM